MYGDHYAALFGRGCEDAGELKIVRGGGKIAYSGIGFTMDVGARRTTRA